MVIAVIAVLATLVLPAATTMWAQRKGAMAQNTIQGLLMIARARALRAGRAESGQFQYYEDGNADSRQASGGETGVLFFVDRDGVQRMVSIAQVNAGDPAWQNVFGVTPDSDMVLPEPMRVVPRYVVDGADSGNAAITFTDAELANNDFGNPDSNANVAQRHRNHFTMIYSDEGHLLTWRDVLIYDEDIDGHGFGDRTGLAVGDGPGGPGGANVLTYYQGGWNNAVVDGTEDDIDPTGGGEAIPYLVTGGYANSGDDVALNLPSVDGLLVYDDALLNELIDAGLKRQYLLASAQPFYVNRLTGAIIRGPKGENVAP